MFLSYELTAIKVNEIFGRNFVEIPFNYFTEMLLRDILRIFPFKYGLIWRVDLFEPEIHDAELVVLCLPGNLVARLFLLGGGGGGRGKIIFLLFL